jgi:hypothetical protein
MIMSPKVAAGLSSHSRLRRGRLLSFLSLTVCWGESEAEREIEEEATGKWAERESLFNKLNE